jgi:hypothetical protein
MSSRWLPDPAAQTAVDLLCEQAPPYQHCAEPVGTRDLSAPVLALLQGSLVGVAARDVARALAVDPRAAMDALQKLKQAGQARRVALTGRRAGYWVYVAPDEATTEITVSAGGHQGDNAND